MARDFAMRREVLLIANELDPVAGEIPMGSDGRWRISASSGSSSPRSTAASGSGLSEYAVIVEELARAWMSVASPIARGQQFTAGFDAEQRREFLPRIARGEFLSAFALSEPDAGSDVANLSCRATADGDG